MTDPDWRLLLFLKDFTERGADCFYWFLDDQLIEADAQDVVKFPGAVVCHDFWMIRDALFDKTGTLPSSVVDIDEFRISTSGFPGDRIAREKQDVSAVLEQHGAEREVCSAYKRMFNKGIPFDLTVATKAAAALAQMYIALLERAQNSGEAERFFSVEVPIYRLLQRAMAAGIVVDNRRLSRCVRRQSTITSFS